MIQDQLTIVTFFRAASSLVLSIALVSGPAEAACRLNLRTDGNFLRWDAVPGATNYWISESLGSSAVSVNHSTKMNAFAMTRRASAPSVIRYRVLAELTGGIRSAAMESTDACTETLDVQIPADLAFRKLTNKAVFPIVGSTAGAMGGRFRTALTLKGTAGMRGRIVFHPAGAVASESDPSIDYSFAAAPILAWDDIVETMGQGGIGSLEIVPDENELARMPDADLRLYNDTAIGTFGTFAAPAFPFEYLHPRPLDVRIPDARFRVNVGLRALTDTKIKILIYSAEGRLRDLRDRSFPAGWMQMTSAAEFAGTPLLPGESMTLLLTGAVIPFYTITENATNDPTLIVASPEPSAFPFGEYID